MKYIISVQFLCLSLFSHSNSRISVKVYPLKVPRSLGSTDSEFIVVYHEHS